MFSVQIEIIRVSVVMKSMESDMLLIRVNFE